MTRSANEVSVLAAKAARGAGAPPAQAAQFGAAAVAHLAAGGDLDVLDAALAELPMGPIITLPLAISGVAEQAKGGHAQGRIAPSLLARSYAASLPYHAVLDGEGMLVLDFDVPATRSAPIRFALSDAVYEQWSALAAAMLVPESEASRLKGAGAGNSDND